MNSKSVKNVLKTLFSLVLGLVIVWMLYRETDMNELWKIAKSANFGIILFSLVFGLLGNILRALRWELFINSLGYHPKRASLIFATLGNFAVNFVLPRAGDIWRCGVVSRYDKIPFAKTLETFLVDKVVEVITGIFIISMSVVLNIDFFVAFFNQNPGFQHSFNQITGSVWIYVALMVLITLVVLVFTVFKNNFVVKKVRGFLLTVKRDLKLIARMEEKRKVIIYTILMWVAFYLYFYICFYAFDFTAGLGLLAGLIVFGMSNIGISVPVQGGIGTWHFMVIASLVILGVSRGQAAAFAGAVFTIQSVWVILCGVVGILALPSVKRNNHETKDIT